MRRCPHTYLPPVDMLGGQVGLAITQATALTGLVQWGIRQSAEAINQLMSVERVLEYSSLPGEEQPRIPRTPPDNWPQQGQIVFNEMGLKYSEDSAPVLKNLNVCIRPKEKVIFLDNITFCHHS